MGTTALLFHQVTQSLGGFPFARTMATAVLAQSGYLVADIYWVLIMFQTTVTVAFNELLRIDYKEPVRWIPL